MKEKKVKKNLKLLIARLLLSFTGLSLVFLSGSLNKDTKFERIAEYSSQIVKTNTISKDYFGMYFDASNKSGDYYARELENLFDVFKTGVVTYTSSMNTNKEHNINIENDYDKNYSLVFVGATGSIESIDEKNGIVSYRHNKYNFDTLFKDPVYNGTDYDKNHAPVVYISISQANKILESQNILKEEGNKYSNEQYKSLIQKDLTLEIDGDPCTYLIWNIFDENGFYPKGIASVLGDFFLTSYYQPPNHDLRQEHKSVYFFNEYSYYNQYLMRYLNERYSEESLNPSIVKNNMIGDVDYNYLLSFFKNESISSGQWAFVLLLIVSACMLGVSLFLTFKFERDSILYKIAVASTLFLPYLLFKIVYIVSKDIMFFSQPSCKWNVAFMVAYFVLYFINVSVRKKKKNSIGHLEYYEVSI